MLNFNLFDSDSEILSKERHHARLFASTRGTIKHQMREILHFNLLEVNMRSRRSITRWIYQLPKFFSYIFVKIKTIKSVWSVFIDPHHVCRCEKSNATGTASCAQACNTYKFICTKGLIFQYVQ